jgi:hypothetical protein
VNIIRREYTASASDNSDTPEASASTAADAGQAPPPMSSASAARSETPPPDLGPAGLGDTADYTDRSSYFSYPTPVSPLPPPAPPRAAPPGPYSTPPLAPPGAGVYPGGRYPVGR